MKTICKMGPLFIFITLVIMWPFTISVFADVGQLSAEIALFSQAELSVTATRIERPLLESPAAIAVITRDEIIRSGATHIPDILRRVAGIDVVEISPGHSEVNIRGLNTAYSPRTSVLIDGRTVFINAQGFIPWESIPVAVEDIERIEIVKGPVEALYGSPALSGVINIITRDPEKVKGTESYTSIGNYETWRQVLRYGASVNEKIAYKVSTEYSKLDAFEGVPVSGKIVHDALERQMVNAAISYKLDNQSKFLFSGGFNNGEFMTLPNPVTGLMPIDHQTSFLKLDFNNVQPEAGRELQIQAFWNRQDFDAINSILSQEVGINTYDLDAHYVFPIGSRHKFLYGAGLRYEEIDSTIFNSSSVSELKSQLNWDLFAQDEYQISDLFSFLGTLRLDRHPKTDYNIASRASLLFKPAENHVLWATVGRTFRNPTFSESLLDIYYSIPTLSPLPFHATGNEKLKPETMDTYELGYRGLIWQRIKPEISLFYNQFKDCVSASYGATEASPFPPYYLATPIGLVNKGNIDILGTEAGATFIVTNWLEAFANYTWLHDHESESPRLADLTPAHNANLGASFTLGKKPRYFLLDIYTTFVSTTSIPATMGGSKIPGYSLTNACLGYHYKDWMEISLDIFNLFHNKHLEYSGAEEVATRVAGKVTLKF